MSEGALIAERAEAGRFERECEGLRPLGEAYVLRRFGGQLNYADAQDAVAEVLIRIHQRASAGETPDNLRAAFFTSVRNAAIDQLRARGTRPTLALDAVQELPGDGIPPNEYAESREEGAVLSEALATMRRNYREAILLRFGVGLTVPEIAKRQGISVEGAKKIVLRATRQVRERLLEVTSASHCGEMQTLAKRQLFERYLAEVASDEEVAQLERHLEHCGRCRSLVVNFHDSLHELASGALLSTGVADQLSGHSPGVLDRVASLAHRAQEHVYSVVNRGSGHETETASGIGAGASGAGFATKALVAACIGGGAASVGGACVATGVVDVPGTGDAAAKEQPAETTPSETVPVSSKPAEDVSGSDASTDSTGSELSTGQKATREFQGSTTASSSSSATSGDFGVVPSSSGGGGGGGSGGGGISFEH
jgi:RNA polymerase sigma factor (sigma-70 family)